MLGGGGVMELQFTSLAVLLVNSPNKTGAAIFNRLGPFPRCFESVRSVISFYSLFKSIKNIYPIHFGSTLTAAKQFTGPQYHHLAINEETRMHVSFLFKQPVPGEILFAGNKVFRSDFP